MNDLSETNRLKLKTKAIRIILLMVFFLLLPALTIFAHGPEGHSGSEFTALQAAQKGIALYDKLVASGKLDQGWETDLADIAVYSRQGANNRELVVRFSRSKGEPQSVYIFFTGKGEYSGSNFTGK